MSWEGEAPAEPLAMQDKLPIRKHPAHGVIHPEGQPTIIFDTVCTKNRYPWLATPVVHEILRKVWQQATAWLVGRYMIMPDHVHFFAAASEPNIPLDNWVKYWKSQVTKQLKAAQAKMDFERCSWQTDHWDTRLRSERAYEEKWLYVVENPVRKSLVENSSDWPYQGEIFELRWD